MISFAKDRKVAPYTMQFGDMPRSLHRLIVNYRSTIASFLVSLLVCDYLVFIRGGRQGWARVGFVNVGIIRTKIPPLAHPALDGAHGPTLL